MEPIKELMPFAGLNGQESVCRVEVVPLKDGRHAVICEELDDNPGASVSDSWEAVVAKVGKKYGVPATGTVWIEHNAEPFEAAGQVMGRWQVVTFKPPRPDEQRGRAEWRNMTDDDWHELGLAPRA
jgi:hypothetical protein